MTTAYKKITTKKKPKADRKPKHSIPLTSEAQYTRTRTEINATNRQRAKAMERRIAKYLRGTRTPGSGAMAKYKGDVSVDFINSPGKYIIECKLSALRNSGTDVPQLSIEFKWFEKMQREAIAITAKFCVLIIHFHGLKEDYVFVRKDHFDWIYQRSELFVLYESIINQNVPIKDIMRFSDGKLRSTYTISVKEIYSLFVPHGVIKIGAVSTPDGTYYILPLDQFRDFISSV